MTVGRVLLGILLLAGVSGATLPRAGHRPRMDCCPDGETMQCCRNQSGCSFEKCGGPETLPPIPVAGPVLPAVPRLVAPDISSLFAALNRGTVPRPPIERPDPPPRA